MLKGTKTIYKDGKAAAWKWGLVGRAFCWRHIETIHSSRAVCSPMPKWFSSVALWHERGLYSTQRLAWFCNHCEQRIQPWTESAWRSVSYGNVLSPPLRRVISSLEKGSTDCQEAEFTGPQWLNRVSHRNFSSWELLAGSTTLVPVSDC